MRKFVQFALIAILVALPACTGQPMRPAATAPAERRAPLTLLISIDGFRPDYLERGITPNLSRLAGQGVRGTMMPSFPTLTFPNHYAMATGLRPDRSGMVENTMLDPAKPGVRFDIHDAVTSRDPFWWNEAEPIWVAAEQAGLPTATMLWPGTDVPIRDTRPTTWFTYDAALTSAQRADAVLDWARRPAANRPRLILLYFDVVDKASHSDGIHSAKIAAQIAEVDTQIGRVTDGLAAMEQPANLVIVSDHGMVDIPPEHVLPLETVVDKATMDAVTPGGPIVSVWPRTPQDEPHVAAALLRPHPHLQCWRKADLPARWHYGLNPRVPPFYCIAENGWRYSAQPPKDHAIGDHGFDNADPEMASLFIAVGPAFRGHETLPKFDNVDIYPLLRDLIGLPPVGGIDGTDAVFARILGR